MLGNEIRHKIPDYDGKLCVDGLTPRASFLTGNIYALAGEDDNFAASLLWGTVLDACASGNSACVISVPGMANNLASSELSDQVHAAIGAKSLSIFETAQNPTKVPGKRRVLHMIEDLRHWGRGNPQLLVINGAETIFPELEISLLRAWREWAECQHSAVLFVFRQSGHDSNKSLRALAEHAHMFAGTAQLKSRYGTTSLEIFHWFHRNGMIAGKSWPVRCGTNGALHVVETAADSRHAVSAAVDETQVIAMKSAFLPKEPFPTDWRIVDDNSDALPTIATGAIAPTFVISFTSTTDFDRIARCVFDLRKQCGSRLKIIIREVNSRLRYSQETLAVRLGANLIIPAEISYPRFLSLTSMVQGQVFPHGLPATYEQAVKEAMPEQEQGYLAPSEFSQAVLAALSHSRVLNVQIALIRLPLAYGLMPLDALRYCKVKRAGDLVSSDEVSVYVFLYACRDTDIDTTLDRLFGLPVSELFSSDDRILSPRAIEEAMRDYEARRAHGNFPDLSEDLAHIGDAAQPQRRESVVAASQNGPASVPIVRYASPPPAVRQPLILRGAPTLTDVSALIT